MLGYDTLYCVAIARLDRLLRWLLLRTRLTILTVYLFLASIKPFVETIEDDLGTLEVPLLFGLSQFLHCGALDDNRGRFVVYFWPLG